MAITESRQLQPDYIEALGKTYAADLTRQAGIPSITTAQAITSPIINLLYVSFIVNSLYFY